MNTLPQSESGSDGAEVAPSRKRELFFSPLREILTSCGTACEKRVMPFNFLNERGAALHESVKLGGVLLGNGVIFNVSELAETSLNRVKRRTGLSNTHLSIPSR